MLMEAGVVAVGHMCQEAIGNGGEVVWRWMAFEDARRALPRLPGYGAARAAWRAARAGFPEARGMLS